MFATFFARKMRRRKKAKKAKRARRRVPKPLCPICYCTCSFISFSLLDSEFRAPCVLTAKVAAPDPRTEFTSTARDTVPSWIRDEQVRGRCCFVGWCRKSVQMVETNEMMAEMPLASKC